MTYSTLWWPCHLDYSCWQLYDRHTDRQTNYSDGHVIWITCVDSCSTDTQTDILLTLMAISFGSLVLTVVWQTHRQTYCIQGKFRPHFIFALFALCSEGEFKTGRIEFYIKEYIIKLERGRIQDCEFKAVYSITYSDGHVIWITDVDDGFGNGCASCWR